MINILGIDPSLTHTAGFHALGHLTAPEVRGFAITTKPKDHAHPIARLRYLRDELARELVVSAASLAPGYLFLEGYAYGAKCSREALGEWGGLVRLLAFEHGWNVVVVPPSTLKAYVSGKGTAPKEMMILETFKRWVRISRARGQPDRRHVDTGVGTTWTAEPAARGHRDRRHADTGIADLRTPGSAPCGHRDRPTWTGGRERRRVADHG